MRRSKDWLDQAMRDLEHARASIELGHFEWSCFAAQQAAEKAIKAVFEDMGAVAWGHSAADLLQELSQHHAATDELMQGAYELDKALHPSALPQCPPFRLTPAAIHPRRSYETGDTCPRNRRLLCASSIPG